MLSHWVIEKLEAVKDEKILLVQDSLRLLSEADGSIHRFANENGFTVIIASTNLVFRELFEKATGSRDTKKILFIDRAPIRRKTHSSLAKAPPPFYPDLISRTAPASRIVISLRHFLIDQTGDSNWPQETDDPRFARLITRNLRAVLKAHASLRIAQNTRFTDQDFKKIVAYSALGIPEAAFKRADPRVYWRIGLFDHPVLEELNLLAPEVAHPILTELRRAPAPFCWFADSPPETILRAFYLSAILLQHTDQWKLLITSIDPDLKPFSTLEPDIIHDAAPELVAINPGRANIDLQMVEDSLNKDSLSCVLLDHLKISENGRFTEIIVNEKYSVLIRSLSMLVALDNLLSDSPAIDIHDKLAHVLFEGPEEGKTTFVEQRSSTAWDNLKEAYRRVYQLRIIRKDLEKEIKNIKVRSPADLSFTWFRSFWNQKRVNRMEFFVSALERLVSSGEFLPRPEKDLPAYFLNALGRIRERISVMRTDIHKSIENVNKIYQELVMLKYKSWIASESPEVIFTNQFLKRCVKPNWDSQKEKAVIFVFDGMRCDIWEELVRPIFEDRMEIIEDYPGSSLLPTETQISRKAIFAGMYPESFDSRSGEDALLKEALYREFGYNVNVEVVTPEGMGTGETIRYRAGRIDCYIFDLCDKELHKIKMKSLPDGRNVPQRPLAFIYQQHIKDIIDTEVMYIIRNLEPDTKVFVIADHGFGPIGRNRVQIDMALLNEPNDCSYLNAILRQRLTEFGASRKVSENVIEFPVSDLRMPDTSDAYDRSSKQNWQKKFSSIIFPRIGFALARPGAHFNPDAYSHGGISIQEMMVPMLALRVKAPEEGILILGSITGPIELIEDEEVEYRMPIKLAQSSKQREIRIETHADYKTKEETASIPHQVQYVTISGGEVIFRFKPDANDATDEERKNGKMERTLILSAQYREKERTVKKTQTIKFSMHLNSEKVVRRVPTHLGKILGLTPKNMK